ncbi:MAG: hypothetical protein M3Y37_03565 [Chloroflexota bacterium]|nr:hypothetical protein [Chloroflexota bacterium]
MNLLHLTGGELTSRLPETPHELPYDRGKIDALVDKVRQGQPFDLLTELLACVDWRGAFAESDGKPITLEDIARLIAYYKQKFSDVGIVYLADLISTEFMTEQRARGDIQFSDKMMQLPQQDPELWQEIRLFFRRKEFVTALLVQSHASRWASLNPDRMEQSDESSGLAGEQN